MHIHINAHKEKSDFHLQRLTHQVPWSASFLCIYFILVLYWRIMSVFSFFLRFFYFQLSVNMFIHIRLLYNFQRPQHRINVFFSLYVCTWWSYETIQQANITPRNKWFRVAKRIFLFLSFFLHKGQINLRYICLQKKNCTWQQPS